MKKFLKFLGRMSLILLETLLLLSVALYGVMYVVAKGPSPAAGRLFVRSVRETSAIGFLAGWFYTPEEIAEIEAAGALTAELESTDTSLVTIEHTPQEKSEGPVADAYGLTDEDGDGLVLVPVSGGSYRGYMLVVYDPMRVIMGCDTETLGVSGLTVENMVKKFDAVAGINGGGFYDPSGSGNGSEPDGMIVYEGKVMYQWYGCKKGFVGLDKNGIMHTGMLTPEDAAAREIRYGCSFGPVLVNNGEAVEPEKLAGGLNPRTAIGQRADGAILLLIIDGRQVASLGATYKDLQDIMLSFGAVTACNLDGGSSSMMWVEDGYVNSSASVIGIRPVPTTFIVLKEGVNRGE